MNDAITLITDEKEDLQTLISAAKCFWILCCIRNSIPIYKTAGKHGIPKVGTRNYLPRPTVFFFPRSGADNSLCSAGPTCAIRFPVLFSSTSEKLYH